MGRTWIKVYCDAWINGSLSREDLDYKGAFITLLAMVGAGKYADSGQLKLTDDLGLNDQNIAHALGVSRQKWTRIKAAMEKNDHITTDPSTNIITINNWAKYQNEYQRQKPYRQKWSTDPEKYTKGKYGTVVKQ